MSKSAHNSGSGRFVIGKTSAEAFSKVEGLARNERTGKLLNGGKSETGSEFRDRVRTDFKRNK